MGFNTRQGDGFRVPCDVIADGQNVVFGSGPTMSIAILENGLWIRGMGTGALSSADCVSFTASRHRFWALVSATRLMTCWQLATWEKLKPETECCSGTTGRACSRKLQSTVQPVRCVNTAEGEGQLSADDTPKQSSISAVCPLGSPVPPLGHVVLIFLPLVHPSPSRVFQIVLCSCSVVRRWVNVRTMSYPTAATKCSIAGKPIAIKRYFPHRTHQLIHRTTWLNFYWWLIH